MKETDTVLLSMSTRKSGQGSGGQQGGASSGASREANPKQKKSGGNKSSGGTDKSKLHDEGDDAPKHTKPSYVSSVTFPAKVRHIY